MPQDFDDTVKGIIWLASAVVFTIFITYYKEILNFVKSFNNNFWTHITTMGLWSILIILGGISTYFIIRTIIKLLISVSNAIDYQIAHRNDKTIANRRETEEIEGLIETKQPIDQKELIEYIEKVKAKIKVSKQSIELSSYTPELKKRLAKATELLENLEKESKIKDMQNKTEQVERELQEMEERRKQKIRQEETRKWKIERDLKINDYFEPRSIFNKRVLTPEQALDTEPPLPQSKLWGITINKEKLTEREVQVLREDGFQQVNDYCVYEKKFCQYLVKRTLNHSVVHTLLVWGAKKLLKDIKEVKNIEEHNTRDADITFKFQGKIYALEIETGTLLDKKNQLKEKLAYLNRKYPKRWMFIVSNRNLLPKYRKFGFSTPRNKVYETLRKLLGI